MYNSHLSFSYVTYTLVLADLVLTDCNVRDTKSNVIIFRQNIDVNDMKTNVIVSVKLVKACILLILAS